LPDFAKQVPVQLGVPVPVAVCPTWGIQVNPDTTQSKSSTTVVAHGILGTNSQHLLSCGKATPVVIACLPDPAKRVPL
jgi:hypothetical protein